MEKSKLKGSLLQIEEFEYSNITPEQLEEIIEVSKLRSNKTKNYLVYNNEEESISLIFVRNGEQVGIMTDLPVESNNDISAYYFAVGFDNLENISCFGERDAVASYEECLEYFEERQLYR